MVKDFLYFFWRCLRLSFVGDWRYYAWMGLLSVIVLLGLHAYTRQLVDGLITTGMTDQVSWGVYIANFTFLVGVAAAAVMLVIPVYIYHNEELHDLVVFGELLAISAILMCLAFVTVDLGRPDRFWHLIPGIGRFNFPGSMLSWDVIVLNGYLLLNLHICGYLIYCRYQEKKPSRWMYIPFVFVAIIWAISIHTVTAFLYVGLGGRPFWNSAIVGPRFLASAFTAGPAIIILALQIARAVTVHRSPGRDASALRDQTGPDHPAGRPATVEDFNQLASHLVAFQAVPPEIRDESLPGMLVFDVPPGTVLVQQDARDSDAFVLLSGSVAVQRNEGDRKDTLAHLHTGDLFGELAPLTGATRSADVVAREPCRILCLTVESLRLLMRVHEVSRLIMEKMRERMVITDRALLTLRAIIQVAMIINVFLLFNEVFKEFYTDSLHIASSKYLFLGLHGHNALVPWIWAAIALNLAAMVLFLLPLTKSLKYLNLACVMAIFGIWIEKGMGLVVPGFIPTPLGEIVEYSPSLNETFVCFGIWALGFLVYTILLRISIPVLRGEITRANETPRTFLPRPGTAG